LLAIGALGLIVYLVSSIGVARLLETASRVAPFLPFVIALEGGRLALDASSTVALLGEARKRLPWGVIVRASLVAYAVFVMVPVGRASAEATKAGLFAPFVGAPRAAAAALIGQGLALFAAAIVGGAGLVAIVLSADAPELVAVMVGQTLAMTALGVLILLGAHGRLVSRFLARSLAAMHLPTGDDGSIRRSVQAMPLVPGLPLAGFAAARVVTVLQIAILVYAMSSPLDVLVPLRGAAVSMIGSVALDLVPADLGLTEGAFVLWHEPIGVGKVDAMVLAITLHAVQAVWVGVGGLTALLTRGPGWGGRERSGESRGRASV
jgi:hypothetical protein